MQGLCDLLWTQGFLLYRLVAHKDCTNKGKTLISIYLRSDPGRGKCLLRDPTYPSDALHESTTNRVIEILQRRTPSNSIKTNDITGRHSQWERIKRPITPNIQGLYTAPPRVNRPDAFFTRALFRKLLQIR